MRKLGSFRAWCRDALARRQARHLRQPVYPFAGTVDVLRRTTKRLGHLEDAQAYCDRLPAHIFCRVDETSVGWWILTERMLWTAQVDRVTLDVAFAACVDYPLGKGDAQEDMRRAMEPLHLPGKTAVPWEQRLAVLGEISNAWMQRNRTGICLPGLVVRGKARKGAHIHTRMRTALRLQQPQHLEVAVPLILHGMWSDMRSSNLMHMGELADAWQLACALVDNPWEGWQAVQAGRFSQMHGSIM